MSATRLLVLGLVKSLGRAHGYVIGKQLLKWRVDEWANTKTGSIYHALRTLTKEGMLASLEVASSDFGPPRTEYEITPAGIVEFNVLLRQAITDVDTRPDMLSAGLVFLTSLTRQEAIDLFKQRAMKFIAMRDTISQNIKDADILVEPDRPQHVESLLIFWTDWVGGAERWCAKIIGTLESGAYVFAGEAENSSAPIKTPAEQV
jgi:DNA-binding PadR family transcriptional regulator